MPVYHSSFNEAKITPSCGAAILPIKTKVKGPAPPAKPDSVDIIDEAIMFFRANVMFRQFEPAGPADLTLAYLTVFIGEVLRVFAKHKKRDDARKAIIALSMSTTFSIPGDKKFAFPGFFKAPEGRAEAESFRSYFRQVREELCERMLDVAYTKTGESNKWWIQFSKRKFMNITDTA